MNALVREPVSMPRLLVCLAQVSGVVLFVGWTSFVIGEFFQNGFTLPDKAAFYQAGTLAVVFGGYLLSRKHALAGSFLAIAATVCFFAIAFVTSGVLPPLDAIYFAVPALLTLAAWAYNRQRRHRHSPR